jgi:hypothetical protein
MMNQTRIVELIGWDLDEYEFRPKALDRESLAKSGCLVAQRPYYQQSNAVCEDETNQLRDMLNVQLARHDLRSEMLGLNWRLGVVDLRCLLAFQRRLSFNPNRQRMSVPQQGDWTALVDIAFASPNKVICDVMHDAASNSVVLTSPNPNLHFHMTQDPSSLITVHAGSPFFEVAHYGGRWFLRDGYHRAYDLLEAGVFHVPAVIVHARTLKELGAVKPRFFPKSVLFADHPPLVTDFLDDSLTIGYYQPPIIKILRVRMEETTTIDLSSEGLQGEKT